MSQGISLGSDGRVKSSWLGFREDLVGVESREGSLKLLGWDGVLCGSRHVGWVSSVEVSCGHRAVLSELEW